MTGPVGRHPAPDDGEQTRILRRQPLAGADPVTTAETGNTADTGRTGIIRRFPTGAIPVANTPPTGIDPPTGIIAVVPAQPESGSLTAQAAVVTAILGGWAAAVVSTNLVTGWWATDRLFCLAIGFLALVLGAASIAGVLLTLRRRAWGPYLLTAGAVVALLTFCGVFIAGARLAGIVYAMPLLPLATLILALLPSTRRWTSPSPRAQSTG